MIGAARALLVGLTLVGVLGTACAGRNIYKQAKFKSPPFERGYAYNTRDEMLDAGVEPVDYGGTIVTADVIYLASENRGIESLYRRGFQRKWFLGIKNGVSGDMLLEKGVLYFGANDGNVYAVEAELGKILWSYSAKTPILARPAIANHRIYFHSADDVIYCLDQNTGKWIWHYKRGGNFITTIKGNSSPVLEGDVVYVGFSDGYLAALNALDGNLKWESRVHMGTKFTDVDATPLLDTDNIYIPSYDGALYVLNKKTGAVRWHVDFGGSKRVIINGNELYLASSDGNVYSLNKDSGRVLWKFELDRGTPTSIVVYGDYLLFGSSQEYFYAVHKGNGKLAYRYDSGLRGGFVTAPVIAGDEIYALSNFGNLYVFKPTHRI